MESMLLSTLTCTPLLWLRGLDEAVSVELSDGQ